MQAPRYFLLLNNLSKKPDSIALVDDSLTLSHRPRYYEWSPLCTLCPHCYRRLIPSRSHLPAPSWWCFTPAVTREKRYEFSIS